MIVRLRPLLIGAVATTLFLQLPGLPPSNGAEPVPTPRLSHRGIDAHARLVEEKQAPLSAAANQIVDLVELRGLTGYAGIVIAVEADKLTLYWKGSVPADLVRLLGQLRRTARIDVISARYSRAELEAESQRILASEAARRLPARYRAHRISVLSDGSGLEITSDQLSPSETELRNNNPRIKRLLAGPGSVNLTRLNDSSPWWGGGRLNIYHNGLLFDTCSTGFAVRAHGFDFMLSAAHCGHDEDEARDGAGDRMGHVADVRLNRESMLVALQGSGGGRVFDGAYNDPTSYSKPVKGWVRNFTGEYLCFSGSWTGIRCNIRIHDDDVNEGGIPYLVRAHHTDGKAIAGYGDSGGPAIGHKAGTNFAELLARGTITKGLIGTEMPCVGAGGARTCYGWVLYMPISVHLNIWNAALTLG